MNKSRFVFKMTAIHIATYILCGLIFSSLFNYQELFKLGEAGYFMREFSGTSSLIGPLVQVIRGILIGIALLVIQGSIWGKRFACLRLWTVLVIFGILSTYGPAPGSIEGIVYTQLPLELHLKGSPEIWTQSLLFYIFDTDTIAFKVSKKHKDAIIVTAISGVLFSFCGILLTLILKADIMASALDMGALCVMGISLIVVFTLSQRYSLSKVSAPVYYLCCYIALAIFPTIYNYTNATALASPLSLITSGLPLIGIYFYWRRGGKI